MKRNDYLMRICPQIDLPVTGSNVRRLCRFRAAAIAQAILGLALRRVPCGVVNPFGKLKFDLGQGGAPMGRR